MKKEIPRLVTKIVKKAQEEDSWVNNAWDNVAGWFGGEPKIIFPEKDGQIKHIFRKDDGHVEDTPENRKMIRDTASDKKNYLGSDERGDDWYQKQLPSGKQVWVQIRLGNRVNNAGINEKPIDLVKKYDLKK